MVWLVVAHGIFIVSSISMWKFGLQEFKFEAVEDSNIDKIDVTEENMFENKSDVEFIDNQNDFDENVEVYYAFTNVNMGVDDAMQDSFIDFDYSQEASSYSADGYGPSKEIIDQFEDSAKKKVNSFKCTLLIPQGFENIHFICTSLNYSISLKKQEKRVSKGWIEKRHRKWSTLWSAFCS